MSKIVRLGSVGEIIDYLEEKYRNEEIKGILVCLTNHDGTFEVGWNKDIGYLERLGLLEAAKGDCHYKALCAYCE